MKNKAIFILGPTGVGKSEFAIKLAQLFNGEIISADSVQVYKGLNIGSAKITLDEMGGIKHYCLDFLEPDAEFSVFEFVEKTKSLINDICSRGALPIVVGGTGLYVKALLEGYDFGGSGKVSELREQLWQMSGEELHKKLEKLEPERAAEISVNDRKKMIRAIEIATFGNQPTKKGCDIDFLVFALTLPREVLYEKINLRVDKMLNAGLVEEVECLMKRGLTEENQSMKAIGYKETLSYLSGEIDYVRMVELIKQHSRNYAKRQMTYLRGMGAKMFDRNDEDAIITYVRDWNENK